LGNFPGEKFGYYDWEAVSVILIHSVQKKIKQLFASKVDAEGDTLHELVRIVFVKFIK
jgi:hypothetical protein